MYIYIVFVFHWHLCIRTANFVINNYILAMKWIYIYYIAFNQQCDVEEFINEESEDDNDLISINDDIDEMICVEFNKSSVWDVKVAKVHQII